MKQLERNTAGLSPERGSFQAVLTVLPNSERSPQSNEFQSKESAKDIEKIYLAERVETIESLRR